jgi:hypothetical protein
MVKSIEVKKYIEEKYPDYVDIFKLAIKNNEIPWIECMPATLKINKQLNVSLITPLSIVEILNYGKDECKRTQVEDPTAWSFAQKAAHEIYEIVYCLETKKPEYIEEQVFDFQFLVSLFGVLLDHGL